MLCLCMPSKLCVSCARSNCSGLIILSLLLLLPLLMCASIMLQDMLCARHTECLLGSNSNLNSSGQVTGLHSGTCCCFCCCRLPSCRTGTGPCVGSRACSAAKARCRNPQPVNNGAEACVSAVLSRVTVHTRQVLGYVGQNRAPLAQIARKSSQDSSTATCWQHPALQRTMHRLLLPLLLLFFLRFGFALAGSAPHCFFGTAESPPVASIVPMRCVSVRREGLSPTASGDSACVWLKAAYV
jgi:hypothetical protein